MELVCEKGIGKTHAKWSPVCTAYYRNLPDIRLNEEIRGDDAKELKKLCPVGVFDIEDIGKHKRAVVKDGGEACTVCRECIRGDKFADKIDLGKRKDVFEFHVESLGIYQPDQLVRESLKILKDKAAFWYDKVPQSSSAEAE